MNVIIISLNSPRFWLTFGWSWLIRGMAIGILSVRFSIDFSTFHWFITGFSLVFTGFSLVFHWFFTGFHWFFIDFSEIYNGRRRGRAGAIFDRFSIDFGRILVYSGLTLGCFGWFWTNSGLFWSNIGLFWRRSRSSARTFRARRSSSTISAEVRPPGRCRCVLVFKMMSFALKNDGFCVKNDGFCVKNDGFCVKNDEFIAVGA